MPITLPQRDENGVIPHNHQEILEDDLIIRRISTLHIVQGGNGEEIISSRAFDQSSGVNAGMSVDIEKLIIEARHDPKTFIKIYPWIGAVAFKAGALRKEEFLVGYDPLPENPYHGEVWGKFSRSRRQKLKALAQWYVR